MSSSSLNIQIRTRLHVMSMERSKWMQFSPNVPVGMQTDTTGAQMCYNWKLSKTGWCTALDRKVLQHLPSSRPEHQWLCVRYGLGACANVL